MISFLLSLLCLPWTFSTWFMTTLPWLAMPFFAAGFLSIVTYVVPILIQIFYCSKVPVNLKTKYNANWALVTGASSGIGAAIVEKLCTQDLNVVLVALDDKLLADFYANITKQYPKLSFRKVGVNLGGGDYITPIQEATKDIDVTLVFNNAGFITAGFFADIPLEKSLANYECNATAAVKVTHLFLSKMVAKQLKGLIAFTSSSAGFVPNPLSSMYASTKAFMTMFATSVAPEVRSLGIDVVVVHPSPMATNFFDNASSLGALMAFKKLANKPSVIADVIFDSAGRFVVRDQGAVSILFRTVLKFVDGNFFSELVARFSHTSGDFKKFTEQRQKAQ